MDDELLLLLPQAEPWLQLEFLIRFRCRRKMRDALAILAPLDNRPQQQRQQQQQQQQQNDELIAAMRCVNFRFNKNDCNACWLPRKHSGKEKKWRSNSSICNCNCNSDLKSESKSESGIGIGIGCCDLSASATYADMTARTQKPMDRRQSWPWLLNHV
ncbi:hypothetical protein ACLKA6_010962 [Drosophila palustris]